MGRRHETRRLAAQGRVRGLQIGQLRLGVAGIRLVPARGAAPVALPEPGRHSAELVVMFEEQHRMAAARQDIGGRQSRETAADDDKTDAEDSGEAERERRAYYPLRAG